MITTEEFKKISRPAMAWFSLVTISFLSFTDGLGVTKTPTYVWDIWQVVVVAIAGGWIASRGVEKSLKIEK